MEPEKKIVVLLAATIIGIVVYFFYFTYMVTKNWAHKRWGKKWEKKNKKELRDFKEVKRDLFLLSLLITAMLAYNIWWLIIPFIGLFVYMEYLYRSIKKELKTRMSYDSYEEYVKWHSSTRYPIKRIYE